MKTILVPVDFSAEAANAAHYAAGLAEQMDAVVTLLYVFHLPIPVSEVPYPMDFSKLEEENRGLLNNLASALELKCKMNPVHLCVPGFVVDEILEAAEEGTYDLIILGMKENGKQRSMLFGSTGSEILKRSAVPVLIIPHDFVFKKPEHILLAFDLTLSRHTELFHPLLLLSRKFDAELHILHVFAQGKDPGVLQEAEELKWNPVFEGLRFNYCFEPEENVEAGVELFEKSHPMDMLVLIPHKHNLLERLFLEVHSKKLMLNSSIPVLCLPDKE